jgi:hypothetical protein
MKKTKFAIQLLVLSISTLWAQQAPLKVSWGKEFSAPRNSTVADIIGFDASGFYVIKNQASGGLFSLNSTLSLDRFDRNMNPSKSLDLELTEGGKRAYLEQMVFLNGKLLLFTSFPDQKTKINSLFVQPVDKQTLLPDNTKKSKVAEINYEGNSKRNSGSFSFRLSQDSSKMLIFNSLPYDYRDPQKFGFIVMDADMKVLWKKDITLPYRDDLFDVESFRVDNYGNAYLLGKLYNEVRKVKRRGDANYIYKVLAYTENGTNNKEYSVSLPDKFLTDMQIGIRSNKDIVCAGFYSDNYTVSIRGTFFISIDANTKEIKTKNFKEFDIGFITQNMTENQAEKAKRKEEKGKDVELYSYDLDKLIVRSDGGALLVGEQFFVKTVTSTYRMGTQTTTSTVTYYYYNDVIVVNIGPQGNIDWAVKVPKRQTSTNDGGFYSSYAMAINKDKLYFVFNDDPDNLDYKGVGRMSQTNIRRQVVTAVTVNAKGEMKKQILGAGVGEVIIRPKVCEQISYSEMLLFGQRSKTQQFGRIVFE